MRSAAVLSRDQVADLLVVIGAIARIVDEVETPPEDRLEQIRRALATIGVDSRQTRAERLASIRLACRR